MRNKKPRTLLWGPRRLACLLLLSLSARYGDPFTSNAREEDQKENEKQRAEQHVVRTLRPCTF